MSNFTVTKTRIQGGIWEGVVRRSGDDTKDPEIEVREQDEIVRSISLTPDNHEAGQWHLSIALPPERLHDGVQVFLILDGQTGEELDRFTILTGEPLEDDLRAEVALLRAELDLLKAAFRRHCRES